MKRTADINEILKPLKDTPFQAYLSKLFRLPTFSTGFSHKSAWRKSGKRRFPFPKNFYAVCFYLQG